MKNVLTMLMLSSLLFKSAIAATSPSVLWISEYHSTTQDRSILNTGPLGYSDVAEMATQLGAINVEVTDTTTITDSLLESYSLVIMGGSETGETPTVSEAVALFNYVYEGGRLLVIGGGYLPAQNYANSVSSLFGVTYYDVYEATGYADTFTADPVTEGISSLIFVGTNFLTVQGSAKLLGSYGTNGMLARSDVGTGAAVFWADDWVFMNTELPNVDNRRFAENILQFGQIPEPTTLCLFAIGSIALLRRRRA